MGVANLPPNPLWSGGDILHTIHAQLIEMIAAAFNHAFK